VRRILLVLALVTGLVAGGCAPAADPVIDSWPVGEPLDCPDAGRCAELVRVGLEGFDERDPGHAPVVATELHREGGFVDPSGRRILTTRSGGCCQVLLMRLADGSTRAIGVGYPGVSDEAIAIPWETVGN
jgi:hypothetical protein